MDSQAFDRIKKDNETLLSVHRKSLISYSRKTTLSLLILMLICLIGLIFPNWPYFWPLVGVGFLIVTIVLFRVHYMWKNSMYLITNLRVIALVQKGFFVSEKHEAYFGDVCQVSAKVTGFFQSMFNYGRVLVQTEAELWLEDIEDPYKVNELLFNAIHRKKHDGMHALPSKFWQDERSGKMITKKKR